MNPGGAAWRERLPKFRAELLRLHGIEGKAFSGTECEAVPKGQSSSCASIKRLAEVGNPLMSLVVLVRPRIDIAILAPRLWTTNLTRCLKGGVLSGTDWTHLTVRPCTMNKDDVSLSLWYRNRRPRTGRSKRQRIYPAQSYALFV